MPGFLVHVGATTQCSHGGMATPTVPNPRVVVSGQPTVTIAGPYVVAGCALPTGAGGPCVTAQWMVGAVRLLSNGQPLVLFDSRAICIPTGVPLLILSAQTRATGS
ncbi:MAG: hypothetical protein ACXW5U_05095 [Thermoanaerobaculia bacterium]